MTQAEARKLESKSQRGPRAGAYLNHDRVSGPTLSGLYGLGREFENSSSGASGARASIFGFPLSEKTQTHWQMQTQRLRLTFTTHKRLPMPDSHDITMLDAVNKSSKQPRTDAHEWQAYPRSEGPGRNSVLDLSCH